MTLSRLDYVVAALEAADHFAGDVLWYSRQRRVRRNLARRPWVVLRDLAARAWVRGKAISLWERMTRMQKWAEMLGLANQGTTWAATVVIARDPKARSRP